MDDHEYRALRARYATPAFPRKNDDPPIAPKDGDLGRIAVFVDDPDSPDPDYRRLLHEMKRRRTERRINDARATGERELLMRLLGVV